MQEFIRVQKSNVSTALLEQSQNVHVHFVIEDIFRKKLINKHKKLNKKLYTVNEALAQNPKNSKQMVQLDTYFVWDLIETYRINMNDVSGLFGQIAFPTADKNQIALNFSGPNRGFKRSSSRSIRLMSETIEVKMDPSSTNRVNLNYYTFDNVWTYETDFQISNESRIDYPYIADEACAFKVPPEISLNVVNFLKTNPNVIGAINKANNLKIKLEHSNGKYVLRGFTTIEKLSSGEILSVVADKDDLW